MAKFVLTSEYTALNANDLSAYLKSSKLSLDVDPVDSTTMGSSGWKENLAGLKSGTLTLEIADDVAAAAVDSILWGLFGTVDDFEVRATSSAVGPSNPKYTGNVLIGKHEIGGGVGDLAGKSIALTVSGVVTRATA